MQVVATKSSRHFYSQEKLDEAVRASVQETRNDTHGAFGQNGGSLRPDDPVQDQVGAQIWADDDEWTVSPLRLLSHADEEGLASAWRSYLAHRGMCETTLCAQVTASR